MTTSELNRRCGTSRVGDVFQEVKKSLVKEGSLSDSMYSRALGEW